MNNDLSIQKLTLDLAKELTSSDDAPSPIRYGTAVVDGQGNLSVKLDGATDATPAVTCIDIKDGTRVQVEIINRQLVVIGSTTMPAITVQEANGLFEKVKAEVGEFQEIYAEKGEIKDLVSETIKTTDIIAESGVIKDLQADTLTVKDKLVAQDAVINDLEANSADFRSLEADYADFKKVIIDDGTFIELVGKNLTVTDLIKGNEAEIKDVRATTIEVADKLTAQEAEITDLTADYGKFKVDLEANQLEVAGKITAHQAVLDSLDVTYADIDFSNIGELAAENLYAKSARIGNVTIKGPTIDEETGEEDPAGMYVSGDITGIHIYGDVIEANTIVADSLITKGTDGLYYKLNLDAGVSLEGIAQEDLETKLHGSNIIAHTVTADEIYVDDLYSLDATIGGFHITEDSLYSGVKESAGNTTRGIFMNDDGEFSIGDSVNYLKFYKDATDDQYKLDISAASLKFTNSTLNLDEVMSKIENVDEDISEARKVATNYLNFDSNGLMIGDFTNAEDGTPVGKNILLTSNGLQIRNKEEVISKFEDTKITLGVEAEVSEDEWPNYIVLEQTQDSSKQLISDLGFYGSNKYLAGWVEGSPHFSKRGGLRTYEKNQTIDLYANGGSVRLSGGLGSAMGQISISPSELNLSKAQGNINIETGRGSLLLKSSAGAGSSGGDIVVSNTSDQAIRINSRHKLAGDTSANPKYYSESISMNNVYGNASTGDPFNGLRLMANLGSPEDISTNSDGNQEYSQIDLNSTGGINIHTSGTGRLASKDQITIRSTEKSIVNQTNTYIYDNAGTYIYSKAGSYISLEASNGSAVITSSKTDGTDSSTQLIGDNVLLHSRKNLFVLDTPDGQTHIKRFSNGITIDDGCYVMTTVFANSYWGMRVPNGDSDWIRSTSNGIIPYKSGGASSLGTSGWPWNSVYANNIYTPNLYINGQRIQIESGTVSISVAANSVGTSQITFAKPFPNNGVRVITTIATSNAVTSSKNMHSQTASITSTGFVMRGVNGHTAALTFYINWIAMANTQ